MNFFLQQANQPRLISKIKQSILMYDSLIFDDGAYLLASTEYGSFDLNIPPDYLEKLPLPVPSEPATKFKIVALDQATGREIDLIPQGEDDSAYFAISCFRQIIENLGIQGEDFIRFEWKQLSPTGEDKLKRILELTRDDQRFIEGHQFLKDKVLRNFYYSLILSESFNTPISVDSLHANLLSKIMSNVAIRADVRLEVLERIGDLLKFCIPDFSSMEIEDILDLRDDTAFISFRSKLLEISNYLTESKTNQFDLSEIDSSFFRDLMAEIFEIAPTDKKLSVNCFLGSAGFIPVIGALATGAGLTSDVIETL